MTACDLARFLADRYQEAEALAEATREGDLDTPTIGTRWHPDRDGCCLKDEFNEWVAERMTRGVTAFVAANDPAHRLADIKLKRAILAEHQPYDCMQPQGQRCYRCASDKAYPSGAAIHEAWPCATVRQLGTEFTGHPGYKPGWAPEGDGR